MGTVMRSAFNAVANLHSRPASLKRVGKTTDPVMYSPIRITPSNFFRFLQGPEYTSIKGAEFIIPIDSMKGEYAQNISLAAIPTDGVYTLAFGINTTTDLAFNASAATIQTALRLLTGMENVIVSGSHTSKIFTITFRGFSVAPALGSLTPGVDYDTTGSFYNLNIPWTQLIKKGDRIVDSNKIWAVDEVIDLHDLGASVMGWRVRCDVVS